MTLDIGEAVRDGVDRATERNGLLLMGAFVLLGVASAVVTQTFTAETATVLAEFARQQGEPFDPSQLGPTPLALPLPLGVALALALVLALLAEALRIVAVRTFVSSERAGVPREFVRRRIAWVTLNGFFGGIVVGALVLIGTVFLIIPGVFLYVSLFFVRQEIAVEDKNFIDAMADSWALTKGERVEVFVLALVVLFLGLFAGLPSLAVGEFNQAASVLVNAVLSAVVGVFVIAIVARAYAQMRADEEEPEPEPDQDVDEYTGALGPEDLDPPE